jgi:hypothetical protein
VKKTKRKRKPKYNPEHVLITARNLLASLEQEALLHPDPRVRSLATEAAPTLRELLLVLSDKTMTKNQALNKIARHPVTTRGGGAILPMLRTPITANKLNKDSYIRDLAAAKEICDLGIESANQSGSDPHEIACLEWCLRAIDHLEGKLKGVNWYSLMELSRSGVNYPAFPDV